MTIRRQHLLASTLLTAVALIAAPALAQPNAPSSSTDDAGTEVGEVVVTGSRIPKNEFNSANPVQVVTSQRAQDTGVADTVQFLQNSTIAAGSPQVNSIISSAFVTNGGPGAATVSLRGLGANRTLVLLNGRRAGPAGTRGGVSSFDLNVLPESSIDHIDILKDGASSIYGSDAVAGVVNIITKKNRNGGEATAFWSDPFDTGGETADFSVSYGKSFDRFRFTVSADYYRQYELENGERSYTQCAEQYIFNQSTLRRADDIDPRTGKFHCTDVDTAHVWVYGYSDVQGGFTSRFGRFQANTDNNLQNFIPRLPPLPAGAGATPDCFNEPLVMDPRCYPGAPSNFYLVGYNAATRAVTNANNIREDQASLIPELDRSTIFADGSFDLNNTTQIYTELLANRRNSKVNGFRQYWTYNYTSAGEGCVTDPNPANNVCLGTDPFSVGWTGEFILSPTPTTDWFDSSTRVDYTRAVLGIRGGFSALGLKDWTWDLYGQASRSLGTYTQQVILDDAIQSQSFRTGSCVGITLPISGRPCIDINFTDPAVLQGDLTPAQRAFLLDTDVGKTKYNQNFIEGTAGGNLFDLPAGPLGLNVGFHVQEDKIDDVPGIISRSGNSWGLTAAGITAGKSQTNEVFAEASVPLLKGHPLIQSLGLTLSGRYTDVDTSGDKTTYKVGLNWQLTPEWKIRATHGTSFRAPALFELFLADQTDFLPQRTVDPCIGWQAALSAGAISQRVANNCANPAGPGGGVSPIHPSGGADALITTFGGLGVLKPETSQSTVVGVVYTPKFANLNLAIDYFDIRVKNEVTNLSNNIPAACYNSLNFPNDPICDLFVRNPGTERIDSIDDQYINIADQRNRGIDFTFSYRRQIPWNIDFTLDGQATWTLQNTQELFTDFEVDNTHRLGYPEFVGNVDAIFNHGPWQFLWGANMVGPQSSLRDYVSPSTNAATLTLDGNQYLVKANVAFQAIHHVSLKYTWKDYTFLAGVQNVFDKAPPSVTTANSGLGLYNYVGVSLENSQYNEGFYGRRGFVRVSKKF